MTSTPRALFKKLLSFNTPTTQSHSPVASFGNNVSHSQQYFPSIPKYSINIVLMGDNCTGKSAFLLKQNQGIFEENLQATMGVSLMQKNVRIKVSKTGEIQSLKDVERGDLGRSKQMDVQLRMWDTNGHEKYRQLLPLYIKDDGTPKLCLIFYDVSDRHSFQEIQKFYKIWSEKLSNSPLQKNSVMIIANKIDLEYTKKNNNGQIKDFVGFQEGVQLAKKLGALFVRSSSLFDVQNILKMAIRYKLGQLGYKCQFPQIEKQQLSINNEKQLKQIRKASSQKMILVDDDDALVECKKGLTNSDKARLLQLLQIFQNLKSKSKHLNFQSIITKYMKTLQMKICLQQKQTNLKTIRSSLYFLHNISAQLQPKYNSPDTPKSQVTQQPISSSLDLGLVNSQIQALQILEKTQQLEIIKVSKVIVNSLRKNIGGGGEEEQENGNEGNGRIGGFRVEDFGEFKDVYERYREVCKEMLGLLDDQRVKELTVKRETFQGFLDTVITYYDSFTKLTQQLLNETQKNLSDLPFDQTISPLPTPSLLSNLLQFFLHQKSQSLTPTSNTSSSSLSSSTKVSQLTNLLQKRQQKQILEGMYQKDEKKIEQNRKLILSYVKKIEEIVEDKIIKNGEEENQMDKWMEQYNGEIFNKQLCAGKKNK